ncbi:MAG: carboxynorspermidine decarboxylase [Hyphomonadaceae bacterium]
MTVNKMDWTIDVSGVETPCFLIDTAALERNLDILRQVQSGAGCKILLALKGFAMWPLAPQIMRALPGVTSSSIDEARLGREEFGGEVHACAPAYSDDDFRQLIRICDHVVFNSPSQAQRLLPIYEAEGARAVSFGLRVNHGHREVETALYDPAAPRSRLGALRQTIPDALFDQLEGLHFHSLCELGADALERTLPAFEAQFGDVIGRMKWVNFGGGHHITRPDYDTALLVKLVREFKQKYGVELYLEPGEAIAIRTGVLVASVLDIVENEGPIAILDTSATAHMPDTLEMPYRAEIFGAGLPGEKKYQYRLGGLTCLAGDVIGDYSFDAPLQIGQKLVFADMAHYTMVKTTTFNGVRLPSIGAADPATGRITIFRRFGYEDYKNRLG